MFPWQDGWFFTRLEDGSVRIEKRKSPDVLSDLLAVAEIPPEQWASIVASVSDGGDTASRREVMKDFHGED